MKQVTKFETESGRQYDTEKEALYDETKEALCAWLYKNCEEDDEGNYVLETLIKPIVNNIEFIDALVLQIKKNHPTNIFDKD